MPRQFRRKFGRPREVVHTLLNAIRPPRFEVGAEFFPQREPEELGIHQNGDRRPSLLTIPRAIRPDGVHLSADENDEGFQIAAMEAGEPCREVVVPLALTAGVIRNAVLPGFQEGFL